MAWERRVEARRDGGVISARGDMGEVEGQGWVLSAWVRVHQPWVDSATWAHRREASGLPDKVTSVLMVSMRLWS